MHRIVGGDPLLLQRRVQVMDAYARLQHDHPALPPSLHDFQVMSLDLVADRMASKMWQSQADITAAVVDKEERHHILSCLPTGMGKTMPMLIASQLLPFGNFLSSQTCDQHNMFFQGSTTMIIAPLTTIKLQLEADCHKLGFSALVGDQVLLAGNVHPLHCPPLLWVPVFVSQLQPEDLERELLKRPSVLIVSAEFLASTEVLSKCLWGVFKTNIKGARCSPELWSGPQWKASCCCHWRMPGARELSGSSKMYNNPGFGFHLRLDGVQVQLWQFHLDVADSSFWSKVGMKTNLWLPPIRVDVTINPILGSWCPVLPWVKTPLEEFVVRKCTILCPLIE